MDCQAVNHFPIVDDNETAASEVTEPRTVGEEAVPPPLGLARRETFEVKVVPPVPHKGDREHVKGAGVVVFANKNLPKNGFNVVKT